MARRTQRTGTVVAAALVATLLLAACGTAGPGTAPAGPSTPSTAGADATPGTTTDPTDAPEGGDVRTRLTDALRATDDATAELVADDATTLTPLSTPWLPGWVVVDVLSRSAHGQRVHVALSDAGEAVVLTGEPQAFVDLLATAGVGVADDAAAIAVVDTYLDVTRSFRQWSQRIVSFDDIRLRPRLDASAQASADAARATLEGVVGPTAATSSGDGFDVVAWVQDGDTVVRHDVHLTRSGGLSDASTTLVTGLPVPISR